MVIYKEDMNLLYIHGLDSNPRSDKVATLEAIADNVWAPQLYYRKNNQVFSDLLPEAIRRDINFIVGSSAGGFMGYWLSKHLNCNALLYNPALAFQSVIQQIIPIKDVPINHRQCQIILGQKDNIIPPQSTIDYLKENDQSEYYQIEIIEGLGHQIDLDTFNSTCQKYIHP
ncbi:hypothetical protein BKI52_36435 [marine bacterium AO1-C]|nr:hypothetical protein BKI52_36435 [marine bacterium AO1-C]